MGTNDVDGAPVGRMSRDEAVAILLSQSQSILEQMFAEHKRFYESGMTDRSAVDGHMGAWYAVSLLGQIAADVKTSGADPRKLLRHFIAYPDRSTYREVQAKHLREVLAYFETAMGGE